MMILSDICSYRSEKVKTSQLSINNYISTENMLPNKMGIEKATNIPSAEYTPRFYKDDILISNIRPYFKKIWQANIDGGCSTDVLVFKNKHKIDPIYLYYILSDDNFFNHAMATSKGTKMPRGDKLAIMNYSVPDFDLNSQIKIGRILRNFDDKIFLNQQQNNNLEQQAQALFKSWFVDFEPFGGKMPDDWKIYKLGDFLPVITGKKNANVSSSEGKYPFFSCSQDIAWTDSYSFEGNAILVAGNGDFNIKFYNGKFEAYQRTYVLIPYKQRYTDWLYYAVKHNLSTITSNARGSVISFITKGNLENFEFAAPSNLENFNIVDVFLTINKCILQNKRENEKLSALRDTLLPKLMSGEIDVSKVNISADKLSFTKE